MTSSHCLLATSGDLVLDPHLDLFFSFSLVYQVALYRRFIHRRPVVRSTINLSLNTCTSNFLYKATFTKQAISCNLPNFLFTLGHNIYKLLTISGILPLQNICCSAAKIIPANLRNSAAKLY